MTKREIIIDGSEGEGGGQVLRTSLSLSAITGKPVRIENVRGKRGKPGLFRQHLTAFKAAAEICGAEIEGAELKSSEIAFHPGTVKAGDYEFSIGSAGATTLVAQTLLPILSFADGDSSVSISGGTHNLWAPTFDYFDRAFLPQFRAMGGRASAFLDAYGFNPAGGGVTRLVIQPVDAIKSLELIEKGELNKKDVDIVLANLPRNIGTREASILSKKAGIDMRDCVIRDVESAGPGNVATYYLDHDNVTEAFTGIGTQGVRAESLASKMADQARAYQTSKAAVGEYLADQLLLPMALLGGGVFTATELSLHTRTNMDIIRAFLDVDFKITQDSKRCWTVEVVK